MADTDQVLNLAAIIRKVDGNHSKGAAALAESILDHPNFRDVLARWGSPAPSPADGEVAELVAWLRSNALTVKKASGNPANKARQCMNRAAELLERQALVPVSISERLPGPKDCDAEGRCWWLALHQSWPCLYLMKADIALAAAVATHWLPAHDLPVPEVGE